MNEQLEMSALPSNENRYGGTFVHSLDSVSSLWKGSCAVNNFRGKLSFLEFVFRINFEDEVHADDSGSASER